MIDQWMTPKWAAERIIETFYGDLSGVDLVLEPTCGEGAFLAALPPDVPAIGVEIDPVLAERARRITGRPVLIGDFCTIDVPTPTRVIGNPPFSMRAFDSILARCHQLLPTEGSAGFILSAGTFQTASRVVNYAVDWGIDVRLIPRNIFPRTQTPMVFATFWKGRRRLFGFALYEETDDVQSLKEQYRALLRECSGSAWRRAVTEAMIALGGKAPLTDIYRELEGKRPTNNQWWREKVRQILQLHCERVDTGIYALPAANP